MKELLFAVMSVSICSAIIGMLSPENESIKKQISFVCGLAICASLCLPILRLLNGESGGFDFSLPEAEENASYEALDEIVRLSVEKISDEMEKEAERIYGIKNASLTLSVDSTDKENIKIISGHLSGDGKLKEAAQYIEKELGCEIGYEE